MIDSLILAFVSFVIGFVAGWLFFRKDGAKVEAAVTSDAAKASAALADLKATADKVKTDL